MDSVFLEALAQARPDPGGGAAAAHSAALGLALLAKVVQLEQQRQGPLKKPGFSWPAPGRWIRSAGRSLRLQAEDVRAYFMLTQARTSRNPREMAAALEEAVACPSGSCSRLKSVGLDSPGRGRMRAPPGV